MAYHGVTLRSGAFQMNPTIRCAGPPLHLRFHRQTPFASRSERLLPFSTGPRKTSGQSAPPRPQPQPLGGESAPREASGAAAGDDADGLGGGAAAVRRGCQRWNPPLGRRRWRWPPWPCRREQRSGRPPGLPSRRLARVAAGWCHLEEAAERGAAGTGMRLRRPSSKCSAGRRTAW